MNRPPDLSPDQRSLLRAYRRSQSLSPDHREQLWEGVAARTHTPTAGRRWWPVVVAIAAAALLVVGLAQLRGQGTERSATSSPNEAAHETPPPTPKAVAVHGRPAATSAAPKGQEGTPAQPPDPHRAPSPGSAHPSADDDPPPRSTGRARARARSTADPADSAGASPSPADRQPATVQRPTCPGVEHESRLLHQARTAVARGELSTALAVLRTHADQCPDAVLREEREALRAIARCRRDRTGTAKRAFEVAFPGSPLLDRVRRECAGTSTEG
ncbi:MAG: hypothetical protein K0V04_30370 [Deltaproteobacteria bacterium]|nr:hypothetical protein [Deltaproteobacteria bacterium]